MFGKYRIEFDCYNLNNKKIDELKKEFEDMKFKIQIYDTIDIIGNIIKTVIKIE